MALSYYISANNCQFKYMGHTTQHYWRSQGNFESTKKKNPKGN